MERLSLGNTEFEGNNNAYVLAGDGELALVDTGVATDATREELREGLARLGHEIAAVDHVVLTHHHPDHAGLAGEIQAESGAVVYAHGADASLVSGEGRSAYEREHEAVLDRWGVPTAKVDELYAFLEAARGIYGTGPTVTSFEDGDELAVDGTRLSVVHAPGHTDGQCWFELPGGSEALVGDVILPEYTPNVGGADVRVERPLATYVETLQRLADRDFDRVWPGHRDPIDDPAGRALEIVDHHRQRAERVVGVLDEHGPADAWTVSAHLFGDLEGIHILHGPGEAAAHLDHLVEAGVASVEDGAYRLLERDVDVEPLL